MAGTPAPTSSPALPPLRRSRSAGSAGGVSFDGADRRRVYSRHHSRFVRVMKLVLPLAALALMVLVVVWSQLDPTDSRFRIGVASLEVEETGEVGMVNARYLGTDSEGRPFSITADLARNLIEGAKEVDLEMPKADLTLEDGTWLVLTANAGTYTEARKELLLRGSVNLFHDAGYEIRTSVAHIDLDHNVAFGDEAVQGQGPFGEMAGQGFELRDNGRTIVLNGKSKVVLYKGMGKDGKR